jgi:uncharacterized membrane protein YhhN
LVQSGVLLTVVALAGLLAAESRGWRAGIWIAKPLAATGFLVAALGAGATGSVYGRWVLLALALCWLGDVLLIPRRQAAFLGGLASFLLGHVAYVAAFFARGLDPAGVLLAAAPAALAFWLAARWLRGSVPQKMRIPVRAYMTVISVMVVAAAGTVTREPQIVVALGALLFYVSDLAVARDRFVAPGVVNKFWGLPLYFGGQLLLALSTALPE